MVYIDFLTKDYFSILFHEGIFFLSWFTKDYFSSRRLFFSNFSDFSDFTLKFVFRKLLHLVRKGQKWPFWKGMKMVLAIFHWFQLFYFLALWYIIWKGPSWPWSNGSWIYLCNRCLSPLMLWIRISIRARYTTLYDEVCRWLIDFLHQ